MVVSAENNFSKSSIRINELIKTMRSAISKSRAERDFLRRQPQNFENVTLAAHQRKHFWGFGRFFGLLNQVQRSILVHKNSLASCQRYHHSVESRALTCPFKQSNLSAWSLLS